MYQANKLLIALALPLSLVLTGCNESEVAHEEKKERPRQSKRISPVSFLTYMNRLHYKIKEHWLPRVESGASGSVMFTASRAGEVTDLKVFRSSGDKAFDKAMLDTINAAAPLPALPHGAPETIPVEFTFDKRVFNQLMKDEPEEIQKALEKLTSRIASASAIEAPDLHLKRAQLWLQLDEKVRAGEDLDAAVAGGKSDLATLLEKAKINSLLENHKECLTDCENILALDPVNVEAHVLASDAHLNLGDLAAAMEAANKAIELAPKHPDGYTARAYVYNLSFKYKRAIEDCDTALTLDPKCLAAYAYRGDAEEELKLYSQALKDYSTNIDLSPLDADALLRRAELYNQTGQFHKAIVDCTDAIKIDSQNGEAYHYRSYANEQLSFTNQAQRDKSKAEALGFVVQ